MTADDFDPETEFDEAVTILGETDGQTGEAATARRQQATGLLLAVVAHQLGGIARSLEALAHPQAVANSDDLLRASHNLGAHASPYDVGR